MNSALILAFSGLFLLGGYFFYGRIIEKFFEVDPSRKTPAHTNYDGIDYVPAKNWLVLFGHHFSSIAGAGPIVGPVVAAALWGWLPAILWILLGTVFLGGVHDFASIIISVRHKALSISSIAEIVVSKKTKLIFLSFVWLALILVIAVFASLCARTLITDTRTVIPCFGLIFVALLVGYMLYWLKLNSVVTTLIGVFFMVGTILLGNRFPIDIGPYGFMIWLGILMIYCFVASILPVQILLQPRDYLSSFLLYFGILFGCIGVLTTHHTLDVPMFSKWNPEGAGWLWPMLFVTIACGANSGFHALIASGTTAKQLPNERFARYIGYGGMALEGFLAVIAVLSIGAGLGRVMLNSMLAKTGQGPIAAFGAGYGELTKRILFGKGNLIAILILNTFILTTLDTATRIARYITEELFKINNRFFATFVVVFISGVLVVTGTWNKIWPLFGASNQLVAALTFIVISSWLLCNKKSLRFTFLPGLFMLLTSMTAILIQMVNFIKNREFLLVIVSMALIILSFSMVVDVIKTARERGFRCGPI